MAIFSQSEHTLSDRIESTFLIILIKSLDVQINREEKVIIH